MSPATPTTYETRFDKWYIENWTHDTSVQGADLLLTGYPYSVEISVPTGGTWLELGVGTGRVVDYHAKVLERARCSGIEYSQYALECARKTLKVSIDLQHGDLRTLSLPKGHYDLITLFGTIQTVEQSQWMTLLKNLMEALKPGGRIGFSVHPLCPLEVIRNARSLSVLRNAVTRGFLERELTKHGFGGRFEIEKHDSFILLQKVLPFFGIQTHKWFGFDELPNTRTARVLTELFRLFFPFLTFGHWWVWVRK